MGGEFCDITRDTVWTCLGLLYLAMDSYDRYNQNILG